jgi:dynein light chain LC8-type
MTALQQLTPVIKTTDMSEDMQAEATEMAVAAMREFKNVEKDVAVHLRKEFDKKYNPTWHCIVGKRFGSFCTHETGHFIYFYLGTTAFLLFKTG